MVLGQFANAFVLGAIYVLIAIGLSLCWGTLNILNLAHGPVFMFSAFICYYITSHTHDNLNLALLLLIGIVVGALIEFFLDAVIFRTIRRRSANASQAEMSTLLASIGAGAILVAIAEGPTEGAAFTVSPSPITSTVHHIGGAYISNLDIMIVVFALGMIVSLALWVQHSRNGRALRAVAFDSETSGLMGINQSRVSALTLLFSGASAGAAGVLLAVVLGALSPLSGQDLLLDAFAAVVLGGVGSVWGTLIGAYILAGGTTYITATTNGSWADAVPFGIIICVLLIRPNGLLGKARVDRA